MMWMEPMARSAGTDLPYIVKNSDILSLIVQLQVM